MGRDEMWDALRPVNKYVRGMHDMHDQQGLPTRSAHHGPDLLSPPVSIISLASPCLALRHCNRLAPGNCTCAERCCSQRGVPERLAGLGLGLGDFVRRACRSCRAVPGWIRSVLITSSKVGPNFLGGVSSMSYGCSILG